MVKVNQKVIKTIILVTILGLFLGCLTIDYKQMGRITLFDWLKRVDYEAKAREIDTAIDKGLVELGVDGRYIIKEQREKKSLSLSGQEKLEWVYITKRVRISPKESLEPYAQAVTQLVNEEGGRVVELKKGQIRGKKILTMELAIKEIPIQRLILEQPGARMAIIIDDLGMGGRVTEDFLALGRPVTFSILPFLPHSQDTAREAKRQGLLVMLHLPMEPKGYPASGKDPGKGAILMSTPGKDISTIIIRDLSEVPYVQGVNNHTGSRLTEDKEIMVRVLQELKKRNLFFIDSMTSPKSVAYSEARRLGLKCAKRDVFLDNEIDLDYIKNQLRLLAAIALKQGQAIGIGHSHSCTARAIKEIIPELEDRGIEFVPVSELID
jgi:polysaccharide deacetylase 2 family uncharacterized protein YibQ